MLCLGHCPDEFVTIYRETTYALSVLWAVIFIEYVICQAINQSLESAFSRIN